MRTNHPMRTNQWNGIDLLASIHVPAARRDGNARLIGNHRKLRATVALNRNLRRNMRSLIGSEPALAGNLVSPLPEATDVMPRQAVTDRQWAIACLVAKGLTNGQIARELVLAEGTVANHVAAILHRLGFGCRAQIAAWVVQQQYLTREPVAAVDQ